MNSPLASECTEYAVSFLPSQEGLVKKLPETDVFLAGTRQKSRLLDSLLSMENFGDRLKEAIERSGLSYRQIAGELEVVHATVSAWTKGKGQPDLDQIQKLSKMLDVDLFWLSFGEKEGGFERLTRDERYLLEMAREIGLAEAAVRLVQTRHPDPRIAGIQATQKGTDRGTAER